MRCISNVISMLHCLVGIMIIMAIKVISTTQQYAFFWWRRVFRKELINGNLFSIPQATISFVSHTHGIIDTISMYGIGMRLLCFMKIYKGINFRKAARCCKYDMNNNVFSSYAG